MVKSKLKSALDNHKGRNIKLEKQRKHEKEVRKLKEKKNKASSLDVDGAKNKDDGAPPVPLDEVEVKVHGKSKKSKKSDVEPTPTEEPEWETDGSDSDGDYDDDMPERAVLNLAHLEDSESDVSSDEEEIQAGEDEEDDKDEDEEAEDDDEEEDDIPLSDLESVASEDKGDIIPHQRLIINNTTALTAALHRIQLPYNKLAFSEYQAVVTDEPVEIEDVEDDLSRELAFYKQCLSSVKDARKRLKKEGVPFSRPADYFAEMVKSDEHMGKIKQKLIDAAAGKKAAAEARKQRDLKKFGKQVQVAKLQERAKEKRETIEKIQTLKRKRQGADITATHEEDLFDVAVKNDDSKPGKRERSDGGGKIFNNKRQKKDQKYGFGGKKRHAKSNDAQSSADGRDFSVKKMKGKTGGASKRPAARIFLSQWSLQYNDKADVCLFQERHDLLLQYLDSPTASTMAEEVFFEESMKTLSPPTISPPTYQKPDDSLYPPAPAPHTTFYLSIIRPHTDTDTITGPVRSFAHLLPSISSIISNSPAAIDKLDNLRETKDAWGDTYEVNDAFDINGFTTFVVDSQRGIYTVLQIHRRVDEAVFEHLPAPVYTVIASGPLVHSAMAVSLAADRRSAGRSGMTKPRGYAATSRLIGSYVERGEAKRMAQGVMRDLMKGMNNVRVTESWDQGGRGTGMLMAMGTRGEMWEVRIMYEDQPLRRAREGMDNEGLKAGWRF
ncbi:hypothetical protein IAQ61_005629 [Plenodomus lingam]|uniref:uncharacterized protein n=1 Tax=Leptosphaeria maculans TaxID=5022 RepID=UPI003326767A|nr:hypothetical protein IAQ61_005629 [Plenodomus lingam]